MFASLYFLTRRPQLGATLVSAMAMARSPAVAGLGVLSVGAMIISALPAACQAEELKCPACNGPHSAASYQCAFYKAALAISVQVQSNRMSRQVAAKRYAELYSDLDGVVASLPRSARGPVIEPSQSISRFPPLPPVSRPSATQPPPCPSSQHVRLTPQTQLTASATASGPSQLSDSQPITAGQRSQPVRRKRTLIESSLPPHLTPEYSQVIRESFAYPTNESSLMEHLTQANSNDHGESNAIHNSDSTGTEQSPPIASLLKKLLGQLVDWLIATFLPQSLRESPLFASAFKFLSGLLKNSSPF